MRRGAKMDININNKVKVKLTQAGLKAATDAGYQHMAQKEDEEGYSSFQLWVLMSIFGPHMYNGMPEVMFEKNSIRIEE
jgi:hypothetical protein